MPYSKADRLQEALLKRIELGEFPPGSKLPSWAELGEQYDVSAQTVRTVMERLKFLGVVEGVPGSGTFVKERE
jgi:DNA-binding GntR family transcriptional regulator